MKFLTVTLLFFILSGTSTCKGKKEVALKTTEKPKNQTLQKETFLLVSLNGNDITSKKLHITFDEARKAASGNAGCNSFSCGYTTENETISFGFARATKMYCEENHKLEHEFMTSLQQVSTKVIQNDSLFLKDSDQNKLFVGIKSMD
ncbi:META domain-containing protein [Aquimarina pacifica]|uniref:META domain-containing protein n=1 Tax=Aquimarina pacifica TaxID=1296415 RepID=UPI000472C969|nr:META domain-containing protein [Aquimarina pacifica]